MVNFSTRAFSVFALLLMATLISSRPAISQELKIGNSSTPPRAVESVEASPTACTPDEASVAAVAPEDKRAKLTAADFLQSNDAGSRNAVASNDGRPKIFNEPLPVFSKISAARSDDPQTGGGTAQANSSTRAPLTSEEKMKRAFRSSFLSPVGYIRTGISAAITQAGEEDQPHKTTEDRFADGLSRFAISFSTRATRILLGSGVYPSLLKQDPRYRPSDKKDAGARTLHAISRVFVTDGDNGESQPNYSRLAGNLSAAALANIWERNTPGRDRIGTRATFRRFSRSLAFDAINNIIFREFWPDILKALGRK